MKNKKLSAKKVINWKEINWKKLSSKESLRILESLITDVGPTNSVEDIKKNR